MHKLIITLLMATFFCFTQAVNIQAETLDGWRFLKWDMNEDTINNLLKSNGYIRLDESDTYPGMLIDNGIRTDLKEIGELSKKYSVTSDTWYKSKEQLNKGQVIQIYFDVNTKKLVGVNSFIPKGTDHELVAKSLKSDFKEGKIIRGKDTQRYTDFFKLIERIRQGKEPILSSTFRDEAYSLRMTFDEYLSSLETTHKSERNQIFAFTFDDGVTTINFIPEKGYILFQPKNYVEKIKTDIKQTKTKKKTEKEKEVKQLY